jgi:hypothetical protein
MKCCYEPDLRSRPRDEQKQEIPLDQQKFASEY